MSIAGREALLRNLRRSRKNNLFLFLDFDGTLAPIRSRPGKAALSRKGRKIIEGLAGWQGFSVAVISGRALDDVRRKVGAKNVIYAGNHGMEIEGPGMAFTAPVTPGTLDDLRRIAAALRARLKGIRGVLVENKGLTVSLHVRMVAGSAVRSVLETFDAVTFPFVAKGSVRVDTGKKVFEVKPNIPWNKGTAVRWLLSRYAAAEGGGVLPVYFGDDITDEDAFRVLDGRGIAVLVGSGNSPHAHYRLRGPGEVLGLLGTLAATGFGGPRRGTERPRTHGDS